VVSRRRVRRVYGWRAERWKFSCLPSPATGARGCHLRPCRLPVLKLRTLTVNGGLDDCRPSRLRRERERVHHVSTGHGRWARRTNKVALAPARSGFDGAAQVAQLRRTVTKKGKKTVEVVYLITSVPRRRSGHPGRLGPRALAYREQAPLGPRRHLPRGQIPGQDRVRVPRHRNAAKFGQSAILRLDGRANIAAANRHHARGPQRTLKLLQAA